MPHVTGGIDLTAKPSLAKYTFRPDDGPVPSAVHSAPDNDQVLLAMIAQQAAVAQDKVRLGEPRQAVGQLRRAYRLAEAHERSSPGAVSPAARLACASVRLQLCAVLSGIGRHPEALLEARNAVAEADGVWRSLFEGIRDEQAATTDGRHHKGKKPLKKLLRNPPAWLEKVVECTVQARHCVALELEFHVNKGLPLQTREPESAPGYAPPASSPDAASAAEGAVAGEDAPRGVLAWLGREFKGHTDRDDVTSAAKGVLGVEDGVGDRGFSIAFTARWDRLAYYGTVVEFRTGHGNVIAVYQDKNSSDLVFEVSRGKLDTKLLVAKAAIDLKVVHRYLCTVTEDGHMMMTRDGALIGEKADGYAPYKLRRDNMSIGNCKDLDRPHHGLVADVVAWNDVVAWSVAMGCLVGTGPHAQKLLRHSVTTGSINERTTLTAFEEIDILHKEGSMLARKLLPSSHPMRSVIDRAQAEHQARRGGGERTRRQNPRSPGGTVLDFGVTGWNSPDSSMCSETPPMDRGHQTSTSSHQRSTGLSTGLSGVFESEEDSEPYELPPLLRWGSRKRLPRTKRPPLFGLASEASESTREPGSQSYMRDSLAFSATGDMLGEDSTLADELRVMSRGSETQISDASASHSVPAGDIFHHQRKGVTQPSSPSGGQSFGASLRASQSQPNLGMAGATSKSSTLGAGGLPKEPPPKNCFEDYRRNVIDPNRMSLTKRTLQTEEGMSKLTEDLRGQGRKFFGLWLKECPDDILFEDRLFHCNAGVRERQKAQKKFTSWQEKAKSSSMVTKDKREVERQLFGTYGVDVSGREPTIAEMRKVLDNSQKRSGLIEKTGEEMAQHQASEAARRQRQEQEDKLGRGRAQLRSQGQMKDLASMFKKSMKKGDKASFEYEVKGEEAGPRSNWQSPHYKEQKPFGY